MHGLLIIDKPVGPTSHDVVARVRRVLGERRIGHTGTLDPLASGVMALVVGRATRLARFLSAADKGYQASIRLGIATDSGDSTGTPIGPPWTGPLPDRDTVDRALDEFRGTFLQQPPAFSAKKIAGKRSYTLARARRDRAGSGSGLALAGPFGLPARVAVTAHTISVVSVEDDCVRLTVECSPGFYVRTLAHDLGERLGLGAHLAALRRTRSGDATEALAMRLADVEDGARGRERAVARLVPIDAMLPSLPSIGLSEGGARKAASGRDLVSSDLAGVLPPMSGGGAKAAPDAWYRLVDPLGRLLALAQPADGSALLHPSVVLV